MASDDLVAFSDPKPATASHVREHGSHRPVFSPDVWGVFVHGFNAHRWSLGPGYSGKEGKLARVYCHADGPAKGTPRVGTVFGALPELFQGGKQALMVAYRCTHDFEPTARAVFEALTADLESRGLSLADCVVITHSMGGLVVCSAMGEALDAAGVGGTTRPHNRSAAAAGADDGPAGASGHNDDHAETNDDDDAARAGKQCDPAAASSEGDPEGRACVAVHAPSPAAGSGGGSAGRSSLRLPRALLMLDPPLNGLSDTACLAVSQGFKHMARAAGRRTGEVLAPGMGVLSGAGVAGAGIQLLSSSVKRGSWLGALAGTALVVGGGAAALWAGTSTDVARAGGNAAGATAEAMAEAAAAQTRRFLAPMVEPTAPQFAGMLRRIRFTAVRLGAWLPVLVMSCALPDKAGQGTTQPGFRDLPSDEETLWSALSGSDAHRLCVREVVPKRFRQALGMGAETLPSGNRFCAVSGLAGKPAASTPRGTAGSASCSSGGAAAGRAGDSCGAAASDPAPAWPSQVGGPALEAAAWNAPVASAGPALSGNRLTAMLAEERGRAELADRNGADLPGASVPAASGVGARAWNHERPDAVSPARGHRVASRTEGGGLCGGGGGGALATGGGGGGGSGSDSAAASKPGLHRRHRSTGGLESTIALNRALDAFNRAGDAAAPVAMDALAEAEFKRGAPVTEEDEAASALRYFLGRGGNPAATEAAMGQEAWLADLVQWSLRTAAKEASAACAAGAGTAGADDCDEPSCGFAAMAHHVTSHGTVFMEAEQRAFVQATLESLPLTDPSAPPDELLRMFDTVCCDLRDDGIEL